MMPLSQVFSYNTVHLIDAAAHWRGLADQREETFAGVRNEAYILSWEGLGADALHERTNADYGTAMESSENLRQAAIIAQDGASTLDQLHSRVLYTPEDAQTDGFAVGEDLSVIDTRPSANPVELTQRQAQAQAYAGKLKAQVADLITHDTQVGTDMTNATAGESKIQFVDHTFKKDPFNNPIPDPPYPAPTGGRSGTFTATVTAAAGSSRTRSSNVRVMMSSGTSPGQRGPSGAASSPARGFFPA